MLAQQDGVVYFRIPRVPADMLNRVSYKSPGRSWICGALAGGGPTVGSSVGVDRGEGNVEEGNVTVNIRAGAAVLAAKLVGVMATAWVACGDNVFWIVEFFELHEANKTMINKQGKNRLIIS